MPLYQLTKETPSGSNEFVSQGGPIEAADPTGDATLDADPGNIVAVVNTAQSTQGGCWGAYRCG